MAERADAALAVVSQGPSQSTEMAPPSATAVTPLPSPMELSTSLSAAPSVQRKQGASPAAEIGASKVPEEDGRSDDDDDDASGEAESSTSASVPNGKDADEDIWPEDVEQAFQEALKLYPPVGRRKLIEHGRRFGRNELIAHYILQKTSKRRTRKQVSSHLQVLGKKTKKQHDVQLHNLQVKLTSPAHRNLLVPPPVPTTIPPTNLGLPPSMGLYNGMTDVGDQALSPRSLQGGYWAIRAPPTLDMLSIMHMTSPVLMRHFYAYMETENDAASAVVSRHLYVHLATDSPSLTFDDRHLRRVDVRQVFDKFSGIADLWRRGPPSAFFLVKLHANLNASQSYGLHAVTSKYECRDRLKLRCSTIACSFGKPVVEKLQVEDATVENNSFVYYFNQSPMCDYMVHFVRKLKALDSTEKMDKVLENFSVLQVITDYNTGQLYMCTAFLFSAVPSGPAPHEIFKLV